MKRFSSVHGQALAGVLAALVAPVLISACSPDSLNPFASASPSPTPVTQASPSASGSAVSNQGATSAQSRLPIAQDLNLDGAITGKIDKAVTSCGGANGQWNAALSASLSGTDLTIYMTLVNDKGTGKYPARNDDGTINIAVHTKSLDYLGDTGGFTIADDHRSGSIDTNFTSGLHVSGNWVCTST
ncbi:MAG: hypothetical protein M3O87_03685 [Candidatus Dormibacteraeota bacterium]|nr:hypothetical protein [Candidatus Dormibacteraeota bacterium]